MLLNFSATKMFALALNRGLGFSMLFAIATGTLLTSCSETPQDGKPQPKKADEVPSPAASTGSDSAGSGVGKETLDASKSASAPNNAPVKKTPGSTDPTVTNSPTVAPPEPPAAPAKREIFQLQKSDKSDYIYSADRNEGASLGYENEGMAFLLFLEQQPGTTGLNRCNANGKHFASTSSNCEGATNEGQLGFISTESQNSTKQLFRCRASIGKYFLTTNSQLCADNNFVNEGSLGFVPSK